MTPDIEVTVDDDDMMEMMMVAGTDDGDKSSSPDDIMKSNKSKANKTNRLTVECVTSELMSKEDGVINFRMCEQWVDVKGG